jgi:hypothetical protein
MNRRIPNGSWCLFRANPGGSRQGKVVLAAHQDIRDESSGAHFTVKVYSSEKAQRGDGGWRHSKVVLSPDSSFAEFRPISFSERDAEGLRVVAEHVAVLG